MILGSLNLVSDLRWSEKPTRKGRNLAECEVSPLAKQLEKSFFVFDQFSKHSNPTFVGNKACDSGNLVSTHRDLRTINRLPETPESRTKTECFNGIPDWRAKIDSQKPTEKCPSTRSSGYASCSSVTSSPHRLREDGVPVTLTTTDEYHVFIDPSYFYVTLKKQTTPSCCSIFNQTILRTMDESGGRIHAAVFALRSDPDYFLTTSQSKELQIQMHSNEITKVTEDSRVFLVHETPTGACIIQPFEHKDCYLHHIDAILSLKKLDLNTRPPEEYYFNVRKVKVNETNSDLVCEAGDEAVTTETACSYTCMTTRAKRQGGHFGGNYSVNVTSQCCHDDKVRRHMDTVACVVTATAEVKLRRPPGHKRDKRVTASKRGSLYNMVAMTGNCFGFGKKEVFSKKAK